MNKFIAFTSLIIILLISGCDIFESPNDTAQVIRRDNKIFIQDRTGKQWDVTHAVDNYGFDAGSFQFGLGPFAITPIRNPKMIGPGEQGYPDANADFLVLGTTLEGDTRAYPLNVLSGHEVADEKFGDIHVAVAY
jgi:hypothetical protein